MKNNFYLLLVLASLIILPQTILAQNKENAKKDIAIQLYSVRDRIGSYVNQTGKYDTDYTAILKELAQMGYTAVEAAGYNDGKFYNRTPQEFRKDVETA